MDKRGETRRPPAVSGGRGVRRQPNNPNSVSREPQKTRNAVKAPKQSGFIKNDDIIRIKGGVDRPMMLIILMLLCFGSVMVFSASYAYAYEQYGDSYYFIKKQLLFCSLGLGAMFVASFIDYRIIRKITLPFFMVSLFLLALVPIFGISAGVATRWIIIGPIRFQPSEIMKLALVLFLALYMSTYQDKIQNYGDFAQSSIWGVFIPVGVIGLVCVLVMLENHFSGTIIIFSIGMVVIFTGGARKFWFAVTGGAAVAAITILIMFTDYAKERIDLWLHPENYSALDEAWQTIQGLNAVGSGGLFGVGLGKSRQKHMFVSQPQNDFIFAIICEELGLLGALLVIALFTLFIWRGFVIALRAPDTFSSLVAVGIVSKVAIQALLNIMVVTNMIPNTGISLPFFSYGGSALAILLGEMGILLSISRYSYNRK